MADGIPRQPDDVSDADLLQRFLSGRQDAFATLVRRYERPLFGYLARFTGDSALADDIFQETFLQVYQSAALFDPSKPFRPWLYTVAVNKARDALRKKGRHPTVPLDAGLSGAQGQNHPVTYADLIPSGIPTPEEIFVNLETRSCVQKMVHELPEGLQNVLILSHFQNLPHKEISEILSIPVGTVKSRLHHAVRVFSEKWKAFATGQLRENPHDTRGEETKEMTP